MNKASRTLNKIQELISLGEKKSNRQAKRIAMKNNIKLGILRREFCQECYAPLNLSRKRINRGYVSMTCSECGKRIRWKTKT